MSILVTGATGTIGTEILRLIGQKNQPGVKALVHNPDKATSVAYQGIEPVIASFEDRPALDAAVNGIETVVLITPAGPQAEEQVSNVVTSAKASGVKKIVRISAIKADPNGPTNNTRAHGQSEAEISQSGLSYVFLRPNLFMQNMFMAVDQISQQGQFSFATGTGKIGMIDTRDIAACAVECALSDRWDGQTLELTGPDAISYSNVADVLSGLRGTPVNYMPMLPDDMFAMIVDAGWGDWMAALARDYGTAYAAGWGNFTTDNVKEITGNPPRAFRECAKEVFLPILRA